MLKALFLAAQLLALAACVAVPVDDGRYPNQTASQRNSHHRHHHDGDRRDRDGDGHDDDDDDDGDGDHEHDGDHNP